MSTALVSVNPMAHVLFGSIRRERNPDTDRRRGLE